jgi:hypothetical protein
VLEVFKICLRKAICPQGVEDLEAEQNWLHLINAIESKVEESRILLDDLKKVLEGNGVVIGPGIYDQLSSFFDLERNDRLYASSILEYLSAPSIQHFNFFKISPTVMASQASEFIRNSVQAVGLERFEREMSEALAAAHPEIQALLAPVQVTVPPVDISKATSPSKKIKGSSQKQRHARKKLDEEAAAEQAKA